MAKKSKGAANARKQGKPSLRLGVALFVPLILVLAVIPLIVQMNLITLPENVRAFWTQNQACAGQRPSPSGTRTGNCSRRYV